MEIETLPRGASRAYVVVSTHGNLSLPTLLCYNEFGFEQIVRTSEMSCSLLPSDQRQL